MNKRNTIAVFVFLAIATISITMLARGVFGATGAAVSQMGSAHGNITNETPTTIYAWAGNVTELSLNASKITAAWQGYYGNVSGIPRRGSCRL